MKSIKFAIEANINNSSSYNQQKSSIEFDTALTETNQPKPKVLTAYNDNSAEAKEIQTYRDEVTVAYAGDWAQFFAEWKKSQDKEFESAKQERAVLFKQNQELISKIDKQSTLLDKQKEQIQKLIDELNQRIQKEKELEEKRAKRRAAKKQPPRDAITHEDFQFIIQSIPYLTLKSARLKVAFTLLYLTGLRVSNLLLFSVQNLNELIDKHSTLIQIIKRGGLKKIIVATEAKNWFRLIQPEIKLLCQDKSAQDYIFTNKEGNLISRVNFNQQLNQVLKEASLKLGKKIFTHSFRITFVTELLQANSIQSVKNIIGHKDIRTTEVYDRNFMGERELRKAIQFVYKKRQKENTSKTD